VAACVAVGAGLAAIVEAAAVGGHPIWEGAAIVAGIAGGIFLAHARWGSRALVVALVVGLSAATAFVQYRQLANVIPHVSSVAYLQVFERGTHEATIAGEGVDPWEYRVLSNWGAQVTLEAARDLGFHDPYVIGFEAFRVLQNLLIFAALWILLRRFGFDRRASALGLGLLAWAMTQALHNSGLAFNTYGDVAFYLIAAVLILDRRYGWIVPLSVVAALNRETSGLIPVMLLAVGIAEGVRSPGGRRALWCGVAGLVGYAVTTIALREIIGSAPLFKPFGLSPGRDYLTFNLRDGLTWEYLFRTVNIVPLIALAGIRSWPRELKAFALAVVPIWIVIHLFSSILAESRLVLAPFAVIFIPGALFALFPSVRQPTRSGTNGSSRNPPAPNAISAPLGPAAS
jgi:hypothetical protein